MNRRDSSRTKSFILLSASILLALLIGEAAVRVLRPGYVPGADPIRNPFWRYDPELGWIHRPGAEGIFARDEFTHHVKINSKGWRDLERTLEKPPGVFRIVVLGDSFTWGHGVEGDRTFTRLMERMDPRLEVVNLGLSASSTDQQLMILRRYGMAYSPDLVLVMVTRNDFTGVMQEAEGSYPKPRFILEPSGELTLANVPVPRVSRLSRLHYRLRRSSGLLNLLESTWERKRAPDRDDIRARRSRSLEVMTAILRRMAAETRATGAELAIGLVPSIAHAELETVPALEKRRFDAVREFGEAEKVPVLDLVPAFRQTARRGTAAPVAGSGLFFARDKHWTEAGHELAAAELLKMLDGEGLLPVADPEGRL